MKNKYFDVRKIILFHTDKHDTRKTNITSCKP